MTTATYTELLQIAKEAVKYIETYISEEKTTFQIDGDNLSAEIVYEAEVGYDPGDRWVAPYSWVMWQDVYVNGVYGEDGENDEEAAECLTTTLKQLLDIKQ